jgi:hypothetical protein
MILCSYILSPAEVTVPGLSWTEPSLLWLTISMPTGSRKSTIYQFLQDVLQKVRDITCKRGNCNYIGYSCCEAPFNTCGIALTSLVL